MTENTPKSQILLARSAAILVIAFIVAGVSWYGFSTDVRQRFWQHLLDRPGGPMTFRIILQPIMAATAALVDGIKDAKLGRSPYLWAVFSSPTERGERLREALVSTGRTILLGLGVDVIYQFIVFKTFYPGEAAIVAIVLCFLPYLLLRGPAARIARWWRGGVHVKETR